MVFFRPNLLSHPNNYIPAPKWYFLPFYAILRSILNKLREALATAGTIIIWLFLPSINISTTRSNIFKPLTNNFLILRCIGQQPVEYPFIKIGMFCTRLYFALFLVIIIFFTIFEKIKF